NSTQFLVQTIGISHLGYCSSHLSGLPSSAIKPLQLRSAHIKFRTLVRIYKTINGSDYQYPITRYTPTTLLCSSTSIHLEVPQTRGPKSKAQRINVLRRSHPLCVHAIHHPTNQSLRSMDTFGYSPTQAHKGAYRKQQRLSRKDPGTLAAMILDGEENHTCRIPVTDGNLRHPW
ncbi:hypothetical protein Z043_121222, partial [Scleropages formosus]